MKRTKTSRTVVVPLMILAILALLVVLKLTASVLIPIVCAMFLYLLFVPLASKLDSAKVPRVISTVIVLLILFLILLVVFYIMSTVLATVAQLLPEYYNRLLQWDAMLTDTLRNRFESDIFQEKSLLGMFNINWSGMIGTLVSKASTIVLNLAKSIGLIFVYLLFLMIERGTFVQKVMKFYPDEQGRRISILVARIVREVERYLVIKTVISLATGICVGVMCYFVGYELYFLAGLIAFAFNFIPSIGSIVATILIVLLSAFQFLPSFIPILIILFGMFAIEMVIGNLIDPKVSGDQLNISPFMILVSLALWGYIWGVIGMLLSVPFVSILRIVSSHVRQLKFVELLLSNPKEAFKDGVHSKKRRKNETLTEEEHFIFGDEDAWNLPQEREREDD